MLFLMLDLRLIFCGILFKFSASYECSMNFHCGVLNQTFRTTPSGLYKHFTSKENSYKHGINLMNFGNPQINGRGQGQRTRQGKSMRQRQWMGRKNGSAERVDRQEEWMSMERGWARRGDGAREWLK